MLSQRDWKRLGIPLPYQPQDLLEGSSVLEALSSQCSTDAPSPTPCGFALGLSGKIESNPCWTLEGQTPRGVGGPHLQGHCPASIPYPKKLQSGGSEHALLCLLSTQDPCWPLGLGTASVSLWTTTAPKHQLGGIPAPDTHAGRRVALRGTQHPRCFKNTQVPGPHCGGQTWAPYGL